MKVAIVGAGWAGIAAASQCLAHGMEVTLYEASHVPGGRARSVTDPELGELDNGQHLLLGAYRQTLELIERDTGPQHLATCFKRLPLTLQSVDGQFSICDRLGLMSSSLGNALALWLGRGLNLHDKWRITSLLLSLRAKRTHTSPRAGQTVAQWLAQHKQTPTACRWLWHPLCLAALNTEPAQACATLFQNVLRDSLVSNEPDSSTLLIPAKDLGAIWPTAIANKVTTKWGTTVRNLDVATDRVAIDGLNYDACVLAVPPASAARIVSSLPAFDALAQHLSQFEYRSIATCYVKLDQHKTLPAPLLMFDHEVSRRESPAHWVFDRTQLMSQTPQAQLSFVISCAEQLEPSDDQALAHQLINQLRSALPDYPGQVVAARCFREKRATFAALPNLHRPGTQTPHERIMLAGDWTDTGYPAVIEGAVSSGVKAANELAALLNKGH